MKQVFIFSSTTDFELLFKSYIEDNIEAKVYTSQDPFGAENKLDAIPNLDLIIVQFKNQTDSNAMKICKWWLENKVDTPILLIGSAEFKNPKIHIIDNNISFEDFFSKMIKLLNIDEKNFKELPEYYSQPLSYFFLLNCAPCDIYVKINKGEDSQFVKLIHEGGEIAEEKLTKFRTSNVEHLYIKKEKKYKFADNLYDNLLLNLKNISHNEEENLKKTQTSYKMAQDLLKDLKISDEVIAITNASVENMIQNVQLNKDLFNLLKKILLNKSSYAYKHSYIVAAIGHEVLMKMGWALDQFYKNYEKFVFLCFMHDVLLTKDEYFSINNRIQLYKSKIPDKDKEIIHTHANEIANLVQGFKHAPIGVDVLLRQHHGATNGIGFPDQYSSSISTMAICFIVLEEFADGVINFSQNQLSLKEMINRLYEIFELPSYKKFIDLLKLVITV